MNKLPMFETKKDEEIAALKAQLAKAQERVKELEASQLESLRLFANSIVRAFKGKDKLSKSDVISISAKRIEQLRQGQK